MIPEDQKNMTTQWWSTKHSIYICHNTYQVKLISFFLFLGRVLLFHVLYIDVFCLYVLICAICRSLSLSLLYTIYVQSYTTNASKNMKVAICTVKSSLVLNIKLDAIIFLTF